MIDDRCQRSLQGNVKALLFRLCSSARFEPESGPFKTRVESKAAAAANPSEGPRGRGAGGPGGRGAGRTRGVALQGLRRRNASFVRRAGFLVCDQVSWIWEPAEGQRDNIAVYHPVYGQSFPNLSFKDRVAFLHNNPENPSIRISRLRMSDAGRFTCEYATYPLGNKQGTTALVMLAKPKNSANAVTAQAGTEAAVVARCQAADAKPAATIKWLASAGGDHTTSSADGPDGTVTVRSEYRLAPTPADDGREVTCVVDQRTQDRTWVQILRLSVEYPPSVSIEGYDHNWYVGRSDAALVCTADGNPRPTAVTWTAASGPLPDSVLVDGNKLTVRKVDDAVNTTFICEVRNKHGAAKDQVTALVIEASEHPSGTGVVAGAVIGSLLALLSVAALAGVLVTRGRRRRRRGADSAAAGGGGGADYGNKARLLSGGEGKNNSGPASAYRGGCDNTGTLTEKADDFRRRPAEPCARDVLPDEAETRKFDDGPEEDERYERFEGGNALPPAYRGRDEIYLGDGMESRRDGSVISRTAIYV
ncbi:PVR cell adhesion molecule related 2 like isoform X1 [Phycodurus eques]|uniref:PVR cell adhesion molecule related 2 like isoform X1 n=1 Tax=Phycodurus eques TaxID=693459 RepID=UPI002ACE1B91|nr:PVR cell adhesion molecule related 2 like isoform X1 [Phycodurus eques]